MNNLSEKNKKNFVLFVHSKCKGSREAVKMLNDSGSQFDFEVQNVANIPSKMLPDFVTGVPMVVDLRQKEVYKGTGCLQFMKKKLDDGLKHYSSETQYVGFNGGLQTSSSLKYCKLDVDEQLSETFEHNKSKSMTFYTMSSKFF